MIALVQRRHKRIELQIRYEVKRPATVKDRKSLNAMLEPMLMRARRHAITVVTVMATIGTEVLGSI